MIKLAFLCTLLGVSIATGQEIRRALPIDSPPIPTSTVGQQARFLAGKELPPDSPLSGRQFTPLYLQHAVDFEKAWQSFASNNFGPQRTWSQQEVVGKTGAARTLFYPFSGPDILNALSFFPDCQNYILIGLEPVGSIVPPEQLDDARLSDALANLRNTTGTVLRFSFFITKDMKNDLDRTDFRGVLPVMMTFLALADCEILSVQFFSLDKNGVPQPTENAAVPPGRIPGVRLDFRQSGSSRPQSVFYLRANLANDGLKSHPGLLRWVSSLGPSLAYIKSASYLMHETSFSEIRNYLLSEPIAILQDDSGIPLRWNCSKTSFNRIWPRPIPKARLAPYRLAPAISGNRESLTCRLQLRRLNLPIPNGGAETAPKGRKECDRPPVR